MVTDQTRHHRLGVPLINCVSTRLLSFLEVSISLKSWLVVIARLCLLQVVFNYQPPNCVNLVVVVVVAISGNDRNEEVMFPREPLPEATDGCHRLEISDCHG